MSQIEELEDQNQKITDDLAVGEKDLYDFSADLLCIQNLTKPLEEKQSSPKKDLPSYKGKNFIDSYDEPKREIFDDYTEDMDNYYKLRILLWVSLILSAFISMEKIQFFEVSNQVNIDNCIWHFALLLLQFPYPKNSIQKDHFSFYTRITC